jgi:DNA-binding Lrp family transcriptional regulator
MRELDETDHTILSLLLDDGRRSWADIADHVDLSAPAVADRVKRLREIGVVRGFTIELDRSRLREGVEVVVELSTTPGETDRVRTALAALADVQHIFTTAGGDLLCTGTLPVDVDDYLTNNVPMDAVREVAVRLLTDTLWHPSLGEATLALPCAECHNTVTREGVTTTFGGEAYAFCCTSCRSQFTERYERMAEDA